MIAYTRLSFTDKDGRAVFVASNEHMLKPYAVFKECNGFVQQVSKWYFYRGCAERALRKLKESE
jgi:hypothetical protein